MNANKSFYLVMLAHEKREQHELKLQDKQNPVMPAQAGIHRSY